MSDLSIGQLTVLGLRYEYEVFIEGVLFEKAFSSSPAKIRKRFFDIRRKYNKILIYQIIKISHWKQGMERRKWETGYIDLNGTYHKSYTNHPYQPKKPFKR